MDNATDIVTVESSEGEDNSTDLTGEECEKRCQAFAEVTGTDTALAMFYLQDRDWNVETSLNDYFQGLGGPEKDHTSHQKVSSPKSSSATTPKLNPSTSSETTSYLTTAPPVLQPEKQGNIRILSWNIDGLDPDNLQSRTEGVCSVLKQTCKTLLGRMANAEPVMFRILFSSAYGENPEVIFLQEVVKRSLVIIQSSLPHYDLYPGYDEPALLSVGAYFTAILVRKDCVVTDNVKLADFPSTKMARNLLEVQCCIKSVPVTLMTSHLESTAEYGEERQRQLRIAFDQMKRCSASTTTVFGGDLNLRDKELTGISTKPTGVYDVWECTGKRPEAKFTWDLSKNDNKQLHGKFQPRCRFDRIYIAHPRDNNNDKVAVRLKPVYFELVGIQRLASCRRFPSDHWGILSHFSIVD